MYIRQTTTRRKKDGSSYHSYRSVESTRIQNKVKQRTLLNLGTGFSLPREQWRELTNRIESILHHQSSLLVVAEVEAEAQRIAANLLKRNKEYAAPDDQPSSCDYRDVDIDSAQSSELRSVGVEHLAYDALQPLELDSHISKIAAYSISD